MIEIVVGSALRGHKLQKSIDCPKKLSLENTLTSWKLCKSYTHLSVKSDNTVTKRRVDSWACIMILRMSDGTGKNTD